MMRMKGSRRQFKHPTKQGVVTVAGKNQMLMFLVERSTAF